MRVRILQNQDSRFAPHKSKSGISLLSNKLEFALPNKIRELFYGNLSQIIRN